ncbi:MAG TPA: hypothetical protein VIE68_03245 [Gemmatimonadota bacterium]|jgi:uncharacterized membrane protein
MAATPPDSQTRSIAALAYALGPVTGIACIVLYRDDPYVRFHGWQSLLLSAFVALAMAGLDAVPLLGLGLVFALFVGTLLLILLLVWQAYRGRWFLLPLLGDMALELSRRGQPGR